MLIQDWSLFWTAVMAVGSVLAILGSIFGWVRKGDLSIQESFKAEIYDKFMTIGRELEKLTGEVRLKMEKAEFNKHEERQEREIADVRRDASTRYDNIMTRIDDNQKELNNKLDVHFDRLIALIKDK